tara:strand:- start:413 stop:655 length:243 start_codon:yes stop_codon:yes gene_type:complete
MTFGFNTKIVYPDNVNEIKNAIILLHGYGGDGNDISILTLSWKRFLPNTIFLCPNGHDHVQLILMVFNGLIFLETILNIY